MFYYSFLKKVNVIQLFHYKPTCNNFIKTFRETSLPHIKLQIQLNGSKYFLCICAKISYHYFLKWEIIAT